MRSFFLLCGLSAAGAMGQSMLEVGGIVAGSSVGSAAGKRLSDSLNSTLKKTAQTAEKASKEGDAKEKSAKGKQRLAEVPEPAPVDPAFLPRRTQGGSAPELDNVPPPPPPKRKTQPPPVRASRPAAPAVVPVRYDIVKPEPLNVDLGKINPGTRREAVLKLGVPSARISMDEAGHLVEIYSYHNATFPSGRVRLEDGTVTSVETR